MPEYFVTVRELMNDPREKSVIDLRTNAEFVRDTLPGAVSVPPESLHEYIRNQPEGRPVYLLTADGKRSEGRTEAGNTDAEIHEIAGGWQSCLWYRLEQEELLPADFRKADAERSLIKTYRDEIWRKFTRAINTYELIQDGDRIAVCISGGKDSMAMAKLFQELERHGRKNFSLVFLVMDPGYNELNRRTVLNNARLLGVPVTVFQTPIFQTVDEAGGSPCYLCARMRRGYLYQKARELGCNKIALGHHFDDVIETTVMSMFYGSQIQTMMPKLHSKNYPGMQLIRPLYLVRENDIIRWARHNDLHFIRCACRRTEQEDPQNAGKRAEVKSLLAELRRKNPCIDMNIFRSMENVCLDTVIQYQLRGEKHHFLAAYDAAGGAGKTGGTEET